LHARANAQGIPLTMCVIAHRCKAVATVSLHNRVLNRRPVRALEIEAMETSRSAGVYSVSHDAPTPHFGALVHSQISG
jgi:hypothetical protein